MSGRSDPRRALVEGPTGTAMAGLEAAEGSTEASRLGAEDGGGQSGVERATGDRCTLGCVVWRTSDSGPPSHRRPATVEARPRAESSQTDDGRVDWTRVCIRACRRRIQRDRDDALLLKPRWRRRRWAGMRHAQRCRRAALLLSPLPDILDSVVGGVRRCNPGRTSHSTRVARVQGG